MGDKDIISKHLIKRIVRDIACYLFNLELTEIEVLETQYQRVEERRADIVARATKKGKPVLLHIEVQNDNDKIMPLRMLRYYTDIAFNWPDESIEQYLIYIGKERSTMSAGIDQLNLQYHYHLIDMHDIDCHTFLQQDNPDALILAILCDFKGRDEKEVISHIIKRLQALTKDNEKAFREFISMLEILSTNRTLSVTIKEVEKEMISMKWEDLPSYEIGFEKGIEAGRLKGLEQGLETGLEKGLEQGRETGIEEGEKILLLRLIRHRFNDETACKAQSIIMTINAIDSLETIGDWVIDCNNGEELLAKLDTL